MEENEGGRLDVPGVPEAALVPLAGSAAGAFGGRIVRLLFLDVDGVLNCHDWDAKAQSCRIRHKCVAQLNRIVRATGVKIVLSSAWRYMIHGKAMTLDGFGYMLRTHGGCGLTPIDCTMPDEHCANCGHRHTKRRDNRLRYDDEGNPVCVGCGKTSHRGAQIAAWLNECRWPVKRYVVIDDCDYGIRDSGHPLVQTSWNWGLSRRKADEAIRILEGNS